MRPKFHTDTGYGNGVNLSLDSDLDALGASEELCANSTIVGRGSPAPQSLGTLMIPGLSVMGLPARIAPTSRLIGQIRTVPAEEASVSTNPPKVCGVFLPVSLFAPIASAVVVRVTISRAVARVFRSQRLPALTPSHMANLTNFLGSDTSWRVQVAGSWQCGACSAGGWRASSRSGAGSGRCAPCGSPGMSVESGILGSTLILLGGITMTCARKR